MSKDTEGLPATGEPYKKPSDGLDVSIEDSAVIIAGDADTFGLHLDLLVEHRLLTGESQLHLAKPGGLDFDAVSVEFASVELAEFYAKYVRQLIDCHVYMSEAVRESDAMLLKLGQLSE